MMRHSYRLILTLAALCLSSGQAGADGQNRAGTAAGMELLIPVGARDMALGGASIATTAGIEALHWNPAGLARSKTGANLIFSTMSYLADIRVNYVATSARFGQLGNLALSLKTLDFGEIPITTETAPDGTGGTFSPTFFTLGVTYGRALTDRISVGSTLHYLVNRIERADATSTAFSAGLQYANLGSVDGLDMGVAVKHIGTRMQFDGPALLRSGQVDQVRRPGALYKVEASSADLPSTFEIGLGYRYTPGTSNQVNMSSIFQHNNFSRDQWKLGAEYMYSDFFALRGGFDYAPDAQGDEQIFSTSFGFGLNMDLGTLKDVRVDYAYTSADLFDALNTFTFQMGF
ncbi:MAG: PorV/PorQ family protein [Candidatus Latescibacteria bacterium]|nr:PorV/PorQ family protein [Candidatus Latescibacterota bacterium]